MKPSQTCQSYQGENPLIHQHQTWVEAKATDIGLYHFETAAAIEDILVCSIRPRVEGKAFYNMLGNRRLADIVVCHTRPERDMSVSFWETTAAVGDTPVCSTRPGTDGNAVDSTVLRSGPYSLTEEVHMMWGNSGGQLTLWSPKGVERRWR